MNFKETSKTNNNMTLKTFPTMNSIDFHVNERAPENVRSKSKNHFLLLFSYEDEDFST